MDDISENPKLFIDTGIIEIILSVDPMNKMYRKFILIPMALNVSKEANSPNMININEYDKLNRKSFLLDVLNNISMKENILLTNLFFGSIFFIVFNFFLNRIKNNILKIKIPSIRNNMGFCLK